MVFGEWRFLVWREIQIRKKFWTVFSILGRNLLVSDSSQKHIWEFSFRYVLLKSSTRIKSLNIRRYLRELSEKNLRLEDSDPWLFNTEIVTGKEYLHIFSLLSLMKKYHCLKQIKFRKYIGISYTYCLAWFITDPKRSEH